MISELRERIGDDARHHGSNRHHVIDRRGERIKSTF
jgi:hypothetical protein